MPISFSCSSEVAHQYEKTSGAAEAKAAQEFSGFHTDSFGATRKGH